jgi:N-acetylgalactosamine-6-sulfatase
VALTSRRSFLQTLSALSAPAQSSRPPNIIFVLADDLGWGDLRCYGHPHIQSPNLDRLAREGAQFTQFYVNGPVCSPSRTAFMTGQYPARHRVHGHFAEAELNRQRGMPNWLDPSAVTLPRLLKGAGYATAHFGKWHLGSGEGAPEPSAYGFDEYRTVNANGPNWDERDPYFRARSSSLIVDEAIRFAEKHRQKPFYINAWSLVPHATLHPTELQMEPYRRFGPIGVPYRGAGEIFYASVTDLDRQVGRLLARLDELGLAQNTLVLFSSDNGPEDIHIRNASHSGIGSAGPFRGRKRSLYEGGVRVPFLARWPARIAPGRVDNGAVLTAVDFLPSLCRLAGVTPPRDWPLDGEDASDIWTGAARPRNKAIHWEWRFNIAGDVLNRSPILAVRNGDWKLLLNPDRSRVELYDIPRDPSELNNQADRKPEVLARLARLSLDWQKTLPPGPVQPGAGKNDYPWPGSTRTAPAGR